jgi:ribosome-binding protein aMBF1 (putative translation factor)
MKRRKNVRAVESIRNSIAREVIARRQALGWDQWTLAKRAKVRQVSVVNIESRLEVSQRIVEKISNALDAGETLSQAPAELEE